MKNSNNLTVTEAQEFMQTAPTPFLVAIVKGEINAVELATFTLASRGILVVKCVGFDEG